MRSTRTSAESVDGAAEESGDVVLNDVEHLLSDQLQDTTAVSKESHRCLVSNTPLTSGNVVLELGDVGSELVGTAVSERLHHLV